MIHVKYISGMNHCIMGLLRIHEKPSFLERKDDKVFKTIIISEIPIKNVDIVNHYIEKVFCAL